MNIEEIISHSLTYSAYRDKVDKLLLEGRTTGSRQTNELVEYTKLNVQRMNRLDKTITIPAEQSTHLRSISVRPIIWLVLGDAWCGDCAQVIPILNKMAVESAGRIELRIISKDLFPEFTESYKASSIPKLLVICKDGMEVVGSWGPRPKPAMDIMRKWKNSEGHISKEDFEKELHLWYAKDKATNIISELIDLMDTKIHTLCAST